MSYFGKIAQKEKGNWGALERETHEREEERDKRDVKKRKKKKNRNPLLSMQ